jgi:molybdopterin-containing oxidoreductase family iron-sulfur binding subunit
MDGTNLPALMIIKSRSKYWLILDEHNRELGSPFNLSIDLTSKYTGCGACIVACHAENSSCCKKEVRVGRDMHWLGV